MDRMYEILTRLADRTQEGKLQWHATADPEGFLTTLDTIGVIISSSGKQGFSSRERHMFQVLNRDGITAEVLETEDEYGLVAHERLATTEQAQAMSRLFALARRSALDVDETLDELVSQLDAIQ